MRDLAWPGEGFNLGEGRGEVRFFGLAGVRWTPAVFRFPPSDFRLPPSALRPHPSNGLRTPNPGFCIT